MDSYSLPVYDSTLLVLDSLASGIVLIDPDSHRICWINKAGLQLIGGSLAEVTDHLCHGFICSAEKNKCPVLDLGQEVDRSERILISIDGRHIPIIKSVNRLQLGDKEYLCEAFTDISELKKSQANCSKAEYALDHATDLICWLNDTGDIVYVNNSMVQRLGYQKQILLQMHIWDICPKLPEKQWPICRDNLIRNNRLQGEFTLRTYGRQNFNVEISASHSVFDNEQYICVIIRDLTERKISEQKLCSKQAELQIMLEQMPCMLWTLGTDLRFTSFSGSGLKSAGRKPEDFIGKTMFEYSSQFDEKSILIKAYRNALKGSPASYEQKTVSNDRYLLCHVRPMCADDESVIGIIGVGIDVTEQKAWEKKIIDNEKKIKHLAHAYVKAQEKEREWLTLEIHDRIIQPLSSMSHALDAIISNKTVSSDVRKIGNAALSQLIIAITETRTIMRELYPATLTRYGLMRVLSTEINQLHDDMGCKVEFTHQCDQDVPHDIQTTFYRVAHEAILNIKRHSEAKNVYVALICDDNIFKMTVNDDGVGFDYKAFSNKHLPGGLESMKQRTEIIGGKFRLQSTKNLGTKISVTINWQNT
ncbi:sensory box sensor histidine kinase [Dehalogenimonas sp. WBC-2]|nr:sensory box sensor histidine kinase [Dehalogenimonas sp. WBC-2]